MTPAGPCAGNAIAPRRIRRRAAPNFCPDSRRGFRSRSCARHDVRSRPTARTGKITRVDRVRSPNVRRKRRVSHRRQAVRDSIGGRSGSGRQSARIPLKSVPEHLPRTGRVGSRHGGIGATGAAVEACEGASAPGRLSDDQCADDPPTILRRALPVAGPDCAVADAGVRRRSCRWPASRLEWARGDACAPHGPWQQLLTAL